jgi:hypothetical protein
MKPNATAGGDGEAILRQAIAMLRRFALRTCGDERGRSCGFCDAYVDGHRAVLRHRPDCIYPEAWTFLMQQESQNALFSRNPQVEPGQLEKARELRRHLHERGVQRKGYDLAPPSGGRRASAHDERADSRVIRLRRPKTTD